MIRKIRKFVGISLFLLPCAIHASFIEATIGTAVVNDATATLYNPGALTLLKNPQILTLDSIAYFHSQFTGQSQQITTGFTQSGQSKSATHYFLPSLYLGFPTLNKLTVGIALVSNFFHRDAEENSVLRYVQANNSVEDIDLISAIGFKLTDQFAIGLGLNISYADFLMQPVTGFPTLNIPDSQSRNKSRGISFGGDIGCLINLSTKTLIGFNYRSAITYQLHGTSVFESNPPIRSNQYHFKFWTPARSVVSINHFLTKSLGLIGTVQYIQWSIFKNIHIHGIATQNGIVDEATVPYHLSNAWLLTAGTHYRITPKWVIRVAGTYNQSPASGNFQVSNGDSFILGASMGYDFSKNISIDSSYAHAFIKNQTIHIMALRNTVTGVNEGSRDAFSLKLTFNI